MSFVRKFSAIDALKKEPLFIDHLRLDIVDGNRSVRGGPRFVFPAIRNERIDFYWGGGKLFSYDTTYGFRTHHKYASVLHGNENNYVSEDKLRSKPIRLIENFREGYVRIKENCEKYSRPEASGVASLYERFSCARKGAPSPVILDIEASFSKNDSREKDRIDIVSLDTTTGVIRFIEAKHYDNNDLRSSSGNPAVLGQIAQYAKQLHLKSGAILEAYRNHAQVINDLFSASIPMPKKVDESPILLIFGFDNEQLVHLNNVIKPPLRKNDLRVYSVGEIKRSELKTVFTGGNEKW